MTLELNPQEKKEAQEQLLSLYRETRQYPRFLTEPRDGRVGGTDRDEILICLLMSMEKSLN